MVFTGEKAREAFTQLINRGLEGQFTVNISESGIVTFKATEGGGNVSKLSRAGKAFYEENSKILNADGITAITVDFATPYVHTGRFNSSTIDMADILQFNRNTNELGGTQLGKLTHELVEQGHAQLGTGQVQRTWKATHPTAIIAENNVNGTLRQDIQNGNVNLGIQDYIRDGRTVRTTINLRQPGTWRSWFMAQDRAIIQVTNTPIN